MSFVVKLKKILSSTIIALTISSLCFFMFHELFPPERVSDVQGNDFFVEKLNDDSKKILLLGGSGAAQLNSTMIDKSLKNNHNSLSFYNLAYNADTPKQRYQSIDETLTLKPELILYAITYYDLNGYTWEDLKKNPQPLPEIQLNPSKLIVSNTDPFSEINPKETTLNFIRNSFADSDLFPTKKDRFQLPNSPFSYFDEYQTVILSDDELKKISQSFVANRVNQDPTLTNEQIDYLKKIIKLSQNQNTELIIIVLPQQEYFLDLVPKQDEKLFLNSLDKLQNEFDVKIYDMSRNYENLEIWQDHNHVAFNPKSEIFSNDIYQIIIDELN